MLKLSSSYIQEDIDGKSLIHVHQEEGNFMRVRIQSRHVSSKAYMLWFKYNSSEIVSILQVSSWSKGCHIHVYILPLCFGFQVSQGGPTWSRKDSGIWESIWMLLLGTLRPWTNLITKALQAA